jgi:antitoxin ParD1/3/4
MATMNISLPDTLKAYVDKQVSERGYGTSSEYVRDLIRREQELGHLRARLLDAAESPIVGEMNQQYFVDLRKRIRKPAAK